MSEDDDSDQGLLDFDNTNMQLGGAMGMYDQDSPVSGNERGTDKKKRRLEKNREAARASRRRKRQHVEVSN
jgi:hypothetical protein